MVKKTHQKNTLEHPFAGLPSQVLALHRIAQDTLGPERRNVTLVEVPGERAGMNDERPRIEQDCNTLVLQGASHVPEKVDRIRMVLDEGGDDRDIGGSGLDPVELFEEVDYLESHSPFRSRHPGTEHIKPEPRPEIRETLLKCIQHKTVDASEIDDIDQFR
jgi:hypothetical protein